MGSVLKAKQWPNGNAAARSFFVGGLNPSPVNTPPPPPPPTVSRPGFEPPTKKCASAVLPFNQRMLDSRKPPRCSRFEPRSGEYAASNSQPPPAPTVSRPGFEPPTKKFASAALPFDRQLFDSDKLPHCLEPDQKLLTPSHPPPTPPPLKKVISSFKG